MPLLLLFLFLVGVACSAAGCGPQPLTVTRQPVTLRIAVAQSCEPLVEDVGAAYERARPWVTVKTEVLNNTLAADALLEDRTDVALLSWYPLAQEEGALWAESFGYDGVAIIVHPSSQFSAIGMAQLGEIFQGRVQEWQGVPLTILSREGGSGTRTAFECLVLDGGETTLNAVVLPSGDATINYVGGHPSAIGYVSTRCLDERVRALPVEGVAPTEAAVADGSYPIRQEFFLATHGEPVGEARQFAQWLLRVATNDNWAQLLKEP